MESPLLREALRAAEKSSFGYSCSSAAGRLLRMLAGQTGVRRAGESGTGAGVGSAWILQGLHRGATLVTVERDAGRAAAAARVLAADPRATVLAEDWTGLRRYAPFDLLFVDGGGKREPDRVVELLAPGARLVLDDFTPSWTSTPLFEGRPDELRLAYLNHPGLDSVEVQISATEVAVIGTRR